MPAFNGNGPLAVQVGPGSTIPLFGAETVAVNENSLVIAPVDAGPVGRSRGITFQFQFAVAPTAAVQIFGSNFSPTSAGPQNGVSLYTSTNKQSDSYTDPNAFAFYWAQLTGYSAGGALSVIAHVG